jgi:hypothetical protein
MKESIVIGAAAALAVFFLQGFVPRVGTGEIAWLVRMAATAGIGAIAGMLIHFIRR